MADSPNTLDIVIRMLAEGDGAKVTADQIAKLKALEAEQSSAGGGPAASATSVGGGGAPRRQGWRSRRSRPPGLHDLDPGILGSYRFQPDPFPH